MAHTVSAVTLLLALTWAVNSDWSGCPGDTWKRHGEYCYWYAKGMGRVHYINAPGLCYSVQPGSTLPSIRNGFEDFYVGNVTDGHAVWMSLVRFPDDNWHWTDIGEVHYTSWASGHPIEGYNCTHHISDEWYSTDCLTDTNGVLCQILARDNTLNTGQTGHK